MVNIEKYTDNSHSYSNISSAVEFVNNSTASEKQEKPMFFNCVILDKNTLKSL